jgi:hypothetical protein
MTIRIGDTVLYGSNSWLVVDVHGYPVKTLDLRRTVIVNPKKRYLDETESRRDVPVEWVTLKETK